jgi:site-specific recombinase XerD
MQTALTLPTTANLPAAALEQLQSWGAVAREALAPATLRAYHADMERFSSWCAARGYGAAPLPATPHLVAAFLQAEDDAGRSVATVRRRLATISAMHRAAGLANPTEHDIVRLTLRGIARARGTAQRQAAPIGEREALRIRAHLGDTVRDLRDQALLLVGRDLLARASELVAVKVEDVQAVEGGAVVSVRRVKTETEPRPLFIGPEAAQAVAAWIERAGLTGGPLFRSVTKSGRATDRAISPRDVSRILKARAELAKLPSAAGVSGHSLRVGMCQDLVAANLEVTAVMQAGGWAGPAMVARYSAKLAAQRGAVARFYGRR